MANQRRPKVGIGILVFKNKKVLLTRRKRVFGSGEWTSPGGHLEFGAIEQTLQALKTGQNFFDN